MKARFNGLIASLGSIGITISMVACGTGELEPNGQHDRGKIADPDGLTGRKSDQSSSTGDPATNTRPPITDAGIMDAGVAGSSDAKVADNGPTPTPSSSAFGMDCRHTACTPVAQSTDPADLPYANKGLTYRAEGRTNGPKGQCKDLIVDYFPSAAACEKVPLRDLPVTLFYGNAGSWGCLGWGKGVQFKTPQDVATQFGKLCGETRKETALGTKLRCGADLIAYGGSGFNYSTLAVAQEIVNQHKDAIISIDLRFRAGDNYTEMGQIIDDIFNGNKIMTKTFLKSRPVWLSIDPEAHVIDGKWGPVPAKVINELCQRYVTKMKSYGHKEAQLECMVYEYGYPSLVADPETLDQSVTPVMMSSVRGATLTVKEEYVVRMAKAYSAAKKVGCMFFTQPHLIGFVDYEGTAYQGGFTFSAGYDQFGNKCDILAYQ